jgi:hypothetical protein
MRLTDGGAWSCGRAATQGQQGELAEAAAPRGGIVLVQLLGESGWRRARSFRAGSGPDMGLEDHCCCKLDTTTERKTVAPGNSYSPLKGVAICRPGRRERGAAHPSDPAAINWAAAHQVTFFLFFFLFSVCNSVLKI